MKNNEYDLFIGKSSENKELEKCIRKFCNNLNKLRYKLEDTNQSWSGKNNKPKIKKTWTTEFEFNQEYEEHNIIIRLYRKPLGK